LDLGYAIKTEHNGTKRDTFSIYFIDILLFLHVVEQVAQGLSFFWGEFSRSGELAEQGNEGAATEVVYDGLKLTADEIFAGDSRGEDVDKAGSVASDQAFGFHALELLLDGGVTDRTRIGWVKRVGDLANAGLAVLPEMVEDCLLGVGHVLLWSGH